jgi:hypothetical protein
VSAGHASRIVREILVYVRGSMRVVAALGLGILFALGAMIGLVLGVVVIFWVSLVRGARAVHADGIVCRAELVARDADLGPRLAGPAIVRLSGAFEAEGAAASDVLGLDIRMRKPAEAASLDASVGDQDLTLGTFESFRTASADRARTDVRDYLANRYSSVTPWWVPDLGPVTFRIAPPPAQPVERAADRAGRLAADIAADRARLVLSAGAIEVAELRLVERVAIDARALRVSMFRQGRAVRPVGFRNGIRATVYPISQLARRLRGG